ncbi:hypothetical protein HANVADRAFT_54170 [Hanseniaspora valbyensis NRRL Y-1626]|uniref:L domain-like protein n=1 Tax=Hanseniaspora valbyensis NRRL Y-1626 TaxID=766949 RepID=A0A1B7T8G1_9ASCO|nr:hypothetical protein HANVADRAFT_54170 [Hanseniaspora valbyensis NRRL Y-1626]
MVDLNNNKAANGGDSTRVEKKIIKELQYERDTTVINNEKLHDLKIVMERECSLYSSVTLNSAFKSFKFDAEKDMLFNQLVEISNTTTNNNNNNKEDNNNNNNTYQNNLEKVFLSQNFLDKLPIQISFLKHLRVLDLKHNSFTEIPFKFLPISLTILEISNNNLNKHISLSSSKANDLVNLKYLNINDNKFTSIHQLTNLLKLPNLKIVDVNNIPDMDTLPNISKDFLTNLRSYLSTNNNNNNNNNNTGLNNNNVHSRYNDYFKRLSVLPEDINEDTSNDGNSRHGSNESKANGIAKQKTSLFKKTTTNIQQSVLSQEIGRSRTPTFSESSNNQYMFGSVVRSRTSSVSDNNGSNSANIKKNIQSMNNNNIIINPVENPSVLNIKKNTSKSKSRKSSFSNINSINGSTSTPNVNQFGYQRISSFSSEHKSNLLEDGKKIDKENITLDNANVTKETLSNARKKSQIIRYDKLLICCRRLLFTFTESQQTLRRVTQFGKDKTVAMNVVQLLYTTSHGIDNLVEVLEKCEEEENLNSTNDNNKKILIKTCQDIFPYFKQIFKLLNNNFNSFFQNVELCFLRMFYMNLLNSYTELYNAYMIIKHKSDQSRSTSVNIKRGVSISKIDHSEQKPDMEIASPGNNDDDTVIINLLSNGKSPSTAMSSQNLETSSITSSHSSNTQQQQLPTQQPPVVTPTLISPPNVATFKRSRSNTFATPPESIISPTVQSNINTNVSNLSSSSAILNSANSITPQPLQTQPIFDDKKLIQSLKTLHTMISQGIVDKINNVITKETFSALYQSCTNCKTIDNMLSTELQNLDLENIGSNKNKIWDLMSQQIKAVLLFLGAVKQNLVELTSVMNDEQSKDAHSQELSSLARLTKEITMLLDKSSFKS